MSPALTGSLDNPPFMIPTPAVLMKTPSPFPRSTALMSEQTILTPLSKETSAIDLASLSKSAIGYPSSTIMPTDMYFGSATETDRSLTVPHTASFPKSPPGKNIGDTTKLSVVKAMLLDSNSKCAASLKKLNSGLCKYLKKTERIKLRVKEPPAP